MNENRKTYEAPDATAIPVAIERSILSNQISSFRTEKSNTEKEDW